MSRLRPTLVLLAILSSGALAQAGEISDGNCSAPPAEAALTSLISALKGVRVPTDGTFVAPPSQRPPASSLPAALAGLLTPAPTTMVYGFPRVGPYLATQVSAEIVDPKSAADVAAGLRAAGWTADTLHVTTLAGFRAELVGWMNRSVIVPFAEPDGSIRFVEPMQWSATTIDLLKDGDLAQIDRIPNAEFLRRWQKAGGDVVVAKPPSPGRQETAIGR